MKARQGFVAISFAMAAIPAALAAQLGVQVTHGLGIARPAEMISVPWQDVSAALPGVHAQKLLVKDAAGHILPYQVIKPDWDAKGIRGGFTELLFQHDFAAGEKEARFTVEAVDYVVPPFAQKTYARFAPERLDDFAWENDRIGHRAYGPALAAPDVNKTGKEVLTASGIDIWSKRVRYPIIDRFYARGDYHRDAGEGLDMYKTGTTRGTGGTGIWDGSKLHISGNFSGWKILANGPIRTIFELRYEAWDANGVQVAELKRVTVDAGHNLDRYDSTFTFTGPQELTIGLGITKKGTEPPEYFTPAEPLRLPAIHALAQWEQHKTQGAMGHAVILPNGESGFGEDAGNQLVFTKAASGRALRYYAGAGWTKSGDFPTKQDWLDYLNAEAARIAAPVKVSTYPIQ